MEAVYAKEKIHTSWQIESASIKNALESIANKLPISRYIPKAVLGVGGSGIVIRLEDALFPAVDNALKFPRPVSGKVNLISEMLGKEMAFLARLRHPGIVKILYYTTLSNVEGYNNLPFYLMETVDGAQSKHFASNKDTSENAFLTLVRESAETLNYLHTNKDAPFAHLDIKPDNIVTDHNGRPVMIDLGTCKLIGTDENKTLVACTRSFAHPQLVQNLTRDPSDNNRARGELRRSEIDLKWDLWAFGLTILSWMGLDPNIGTQEPDAIIDRLSPYTRKYLLLLVSRLLIDAPPNWLFRRIGLDPNFVKEFGISTAGQLCDLLNRIGSNRGPLENIPELAPATTGSIQAGPGVHVVNTNRLKLTLSHRLVRRLNSITQLGLVSQVYPSAKHSRREHSLGTYANAGRIVQALYNDSVSPLFRQIIEEQDICDILLASLLHDIGQFPLAHDLEEIDKKIFDHDNLTLAMLKGSWEKKKKKSKEVTFESLKDVFDVWGTNADRITDILTARPASTTTKARQKLLRSIISGPIDADKLDYLFRDARHTDVPYPNGIDVDMLFRCMTTIVIDRIEGGMRYIPAIGIHAKGKVAGEFLTLARYAMFSQVYWHHAVRVQKAMLFRAVEALISHKNTDEKRNGFTSKFVEMVCSLPEALYEKGETTPELFPEIESKPDNINIGRGTDLSSTDAAVLTWLYDRLKEEHLQEATLIDNILTRSWFKRLWVVSRDMQEKRWDKIVKAWNQLDRKKRDDAFLSFEQAISMKFSQDAVDITNFPAETSKSLIHEMTAARRPWLLVDIPGARPGSETGLHYVLESQGRKLRKDDRTVTELQQSAVWEDYARDLSQAAGKIRIFAHPKLVDILDASLKWDEGIDLLLSSLEGHIT
jgi:serine/threonine protein kinase